MAKDNPFEKDDYQRFYVEKPDKDFSPARNKAIIEQTIKDYEAMREKKGKEHDGAYEERADAVTMYLKHLSGYGEKTVDQYFGRKLLAKLRGDAIKQKLMENMKYMNKEGKIISPSEIIKI
jgi:hypothetical protein